MPEVATTQLHAAYAALTPGLPHHWSSQRPFLSLRIPLEKVIHQILISAFTGYAVSSELEGELLSLPVRLAGIGLANQATSYPHSYFLYLQTTYYCLLALIITQETYLAVNVGEVENKKETR